MTREEISTFRTGDGFYELKFSEAEMKDAFNGGFLDAINRILEIIDKRIIIQEMKRTEANDILHEITAEIRATEVKEIRNEILTLKGGEGYSDI